MESRLTALRVVIIVSPVTTTGALHARIPFKVHLLAPVPLVIITLMILVSASYATIAVLNAPVQNAPRAIVVPIGKAMIATAQ